MLLRRLIPLLLWSAMATPPAHAQWQANGTPVCTAAGANPQWIAAVSDGAGGVLAFWTDYRIGRGHIWMQHLNGAGTPLWAADGIPIWGLNGEMDQCVATTDGTGGAFVSWPVYVDQVYTDLYAQHVLSNGSQVWGVDGKEVCTAAAGQYATGIVNDGYFSEIAGQGPGPIIVWGDTRPGGPPFYSHIYLQALDTNGNKRFASDGVLCGVSDGTDGDGMIVTDGIGAFNQRKGAYVMWRNTTAENLRGQHMLADGSLVWGAGGTDLTSGEHLAFSGAVIFSGSGNMIYGWVYQQAVSPFQYILKLQRSGNAGAWASPATVCQGVSSSRHDLAMVSDGKQGALVAWADNRNPVTHTDIYVQRVDQNGTPRWNANGVLVCSAPGPQTRVGMIGDNAGGAILVWLDDRDGDEDFYAQRVDSTGVPQWNPDGIPVCVAPGPQVAEGRGVKLVSDGAGGAIAVWEDDRSGAGAPGVYAQRILHDGGVVAVGDRKTSSFALREALPNPMSEKTVLSFDLSVASPVHAAVFSASGRLVRALSQGREFAAGRQSLVWDRTNAAHERVSPGIYFLRVEAMGSSAVRRIAVMP